MEDIPAANQLIDPEMIDYVADAAEVIGSEYHGKRSGSFGDTGVFSFHGSKTMTTGEGGMLVTDRKDLYERCLALRDHGRAPGEKMFWNAEVGYKYKMSSMQAALGLAQLERIEELVEKKRQISSWYRQNLQSVEGITLNYEAAGTKNSYWMVTAIFDSKFGLEKEEIMRRMKEKDIDLRPFFYPLSSEPAYYEFPAVHSAQKRNVVSYRISPYGVNLLCGMNMTEKMVERVCEVIKRILKK
jgi:perosamine synthetase